MATICGEIVAPFKTELGWTAFYFGPLGLERLTFDHHSARAAQIGMNEISQTNAARTTKVSTELSATQIEHWCGELRDRLAAYAAGAAISFLDVPLNLTPFTQFQQCVYTACREIPAGTTLTYAELAGKAGSPLAARAIGNAMSRNRMPIVVPCHRVVGSHGSLGGFSSPSGLDMKRRLLAMECQYGG